MPEPLLPLSSHIALVIDGMTRRDVALFQPFHDASRSSTKGADHSDGHKRERVDRIRPSTGRVLHSREERIGQRVEQHSYQTEYTH